MMLVLDLTYESHQFLIHTSWEKILGPVLAIGIEVVCVWKHNTIKS